MSRAAQSLYAAFTTAITSSGWAAARPSHWTNPERASDEIFAYYLA
jgi:hypothetical protein